MRVRKGVVTLARKPPSSLSERVKDLPPPATQATRARLLSLDILRGLTVALMIVVNAPGSWSHVYAPLLHASWHGLTPTDLVFPSFLCVVGISIVLAYQKFNDTPGLKKPTGKILVRALKIFLLGLFLSLWPEFAFEDFRWAGVLQRIALLFAASALLFLTFRTRTLWIVTVTILLGYWIILATVPVGRDAVIEGALRDGVVERAGGRTVPVHVVERDAHTLQPNFEPGTNLAARIDRQLLPGRMYERTWDPEGIASTVPALATCLIGVLVGAALTKRRSPIANARLLLVTGVALLLAGYAWHTVFPINKNLWSSSFVLAAGGWTLLAFAGTVWLVDERKFTRPFYPFLVFGTNPIVAYVIAGMLWALTHRAVFSSRSLANQFMDAMVGAGVSAKFASLLSALIYATIVFIPVAILHRKKIFLRL